MSTQHTTLSADSTTIAYRTFGTPGQPAVLLVHGWMVSGAVWDAWLGALDASSYYYIIPDLRGSGASARPSEGFTHAALAADALACLDAEGVKTAAVVGHSMGGQLAQWIASHHPGRVSAVVALNPVPASGLPLPADADGLFFNSGGSREMQGTILDLACKTLPSSAREALLDDAATIEPACIQQVYRMWSGASFAEQLVHLQAPTLVVATDDPFLPPAFLTEAVVSLIVRGRLVYLPGPGHYPQVEAPGATAAVVLAFLAGAFGAVDVC